MGTTSSSTVSSINELSIGVDGKKTQEISEKIRSTIEERIVNRLDDWAQNPMLSTIGKHWKGLAYDNFSKSLLASNESLKNVLRIMYNTLADNLLVQADNYFEHDKKLAENIDTNSIFGEVDY